MNSAMGLGRYQFVRRIGLLAVVACVLVSCGSGDEAEKRTSKPTDWYLRSVSADGRTINFVYTISGVASDCERKGRAKVEESDETVRIIAYKSVTSDRNRACTEELGYIDESVTLARPLGRRALLGCTPRSVEGSRDAVCRDLQRSKNAGIFEFPPPPSAG
jgi:hypothetical protein